MSVHRGNRGGGGPADPQQQQPQTTTISHANCRKVWDFCQTNSIINVLIRASTVLPKRSFLPVICLRNKRPVKVLSDSKLTSVNQEDQSDYLKPLWNHSTCLTFYITSYTLSNFSSSLAIFDFTILFFNRLTNVNIASLSGSIYPKIFSVKY